MLILLPIIILLFTAGTMVVLAQFQPRFTFHWLIATGGALAAWVMTWVLGFSLPQSQILINWQADALFKSAPALLVDTYSWPFMLALTTLALAVILTNVRYAAELNWQTWAGNLAMIAVGLLAVIAGNPLTLVLVWSAIDILELTILLPRRLSVEARQGVMIYSALSVLGTMMVIAGDLLARSTGQTFSFTFMPQHIGIFLLLGVGLRLGVLPLHVPFVREPNLRRGFGTIIRFMPVAASMVLLPRIATVSMDFRFSGLVTLFLLLSAAYGAVAWVRMPTELAGRPYWVLGVSSLAFAAALNGLPAATLAWSLALLFSGGILFLYSESDRRLIFLPVLGVLGMVALPFTPTYAGSALVGGEFKPLLWLFLPVWGLLLAGFVQHMLRKRESFKVGPARWVALIYPLGLAILPITHWVIGIFYMPEQTGSTFWPGLLAVGFAGIGAIFASRGLDIPRRIFVQLDVVFSFRWLYVVVGRVYALIENVVFRLTSVLEGEGGVLWSILLAILLISLLVQLGGGEL